MNPGWAAYETAILRSGIRTRLAWSTLRCQDAHDSPCLSPAMRNGRCRIHGGLSTGPRTPEGLECSRRARWIHGERPAETITRYRLYRRIGQLLSAGPRGGAQGEALEPARVQRCSRVETGRAPSACGSYDCGVEMVSLAALRSRCFVWRSRRWSGNACFSPVRSKIVGQLGAQSERSWITGSTGAEESRVPPWSGASTPPAGALEFRGQHDENLAWLDPCAAYLKLLQLPGFTWFEDCRALLNARARCQIRTGHHLPFAMMPRSHTSIGDCFAFRPTETLLHDPDAQTACGSVQRKQVMPSLPKIAPQLCGAVHEPERMSRARLLLIGNRKQLSVLRLRIGGAKSCRVRRK
jgi:hypothetical protein